LDETSHFADILLPDCTDLEGTQLIRLGGTHYFEQFWEAEGWVLRQPVVAPRGEAREFSWIAAELAKRIGLLEDFNTMINVGVCGLPLKTDKYDFALDVTTQHSPDEIWDAVCRAASYDVTGGQASDGLDYFKEHGFRVRPFPKINWYLYPRMVDQGLRFELPYQERVFRIGQQLANRLHENNISWWDKQLAEYEAFPHWKDLNRLWNDALEKNYSVKADDYPFWLLTSRSMQYAWGGNVGIQLMKEVADNVIGHGGIQINANKARQLGIEDGDLIEVTSAIGTTSGKAILRQGVRSDVIVMVGQFGHWKTPYAKDLKMPSLNALVPMHMDFIDATGSSIDAAKVNVRLLRS
jgi:phenylacetyl-CoA:acceptor oxidoreductase